MAENETEIVYISQAEFATRVEERPHLTAQFKSKRGTINKFEIVIREIVESKYDESYLDFENCDILERKKLRSAYDRIIKKMRRNVQNRKSLSHDLPNDKPFICSSDYPTLVVYAPNPVHERYIHKYIYINYFSFTI